MRAPDILRVLVLLSGALSTPIAAQSAAPTRDTVVVGRVRDASSRVGLEGVEIRIDGQAAAGLTDADGSFALAGLAPGTYVLRATRFGFADLLLRAVQVGPGEKRVLDLFMTPEAIPIEALVVSPGAFSFMAGSPSARQALSRSDIESVPQFAEDIFRAVNRLPGLSSSDYSANFSIRGGRADETLILMDGLEIFEPYHLKDFADGALSILDVETIEGVDLMTGGFPAQWGNRMSGVFSVTTRDPQPGPARYSVGVSLMNARAMAEGSFAGGRGSYLVSGRRGYLDVLLDLLKQIDLPAPTYYDFFAKARYDISERHTLSLNAMHARDVYTFQSAGTTGFADSIRTSEAANNRYGNSYAWLTVRSRLADRLRVTTLASAGVVTSVRDGAESYIDRASDIYSLTNQRDFTVLGVKQDWSLTLTDRLALTAGADLRSLDGEYQVTNTVGQNPDDPSPDTLAVYPYETRSMVRRTGSSVGAYASMRVRPPGPVTVEIGGRYDGSDYTGDGDLSPRVNLLLDLAPRTSLRLGWGTFRQMQGIVDVVALEGPASYFPSERSAQLTAGLEHDLGQGDFVRVEAFRKRGSRSRPEFRNFRGGLDVFPETSEDRILVNIDSTTARGIELFGRKHMGERLTVSASYALARLNEYSSSIANVNVPLDLEFDTEHPAPKDQRHTVKLDLTWLHSDTWTAHGALSFHTGWPGTTERLVQVTTASGAVDWAVYPEQIYGVRFPSYQRFDVRITKRVAKASGDLRVFFEVTNLTNHENVFGYDYFRVTGTDGSITLSRDRETGFIIMPSLGVSWKGPF